MPGAAFTQLRAFKLQERKGKYKGTLIPAKQGKDLNFTVNRYFIYLLKVTF